MHTKIKWSQGHEKTHYDKIKEKLRGKSNAELRPMSDDEHIELIAEISWKLGKDRRKFDPKRCWKNVFRCRQKGRAYKAFVDH